MRPSQATRETVWARDLSRCFRCSIMLHCGQGGYSIHHRKPPGIGGSKDPVMHGPSNLILLCGSGVTGCHGWVESHRPQATDLGLLVPRNSLALPTDVPVKRWGSEWVTLQHDGGVLVGV